MNIFESIRQKTVENNAEYIRTVCAEEIKKRIEDAVNEIVVEEGNERLDAMVDAILHAAANKAVYEIKEYIPELGDSSHEAEQARKLIVRSVVLSGQYFKKSMHNAVGSFFVTLRIRVAETIASTVAEGMAFKAMEEGKMIGPGSED
jgi:hypothetical protein